MTLQEIYNKATDVKKMSRYEEYNYEYFKTIVVDEELQKKYGNSRNGYEQYRKDLNVRSLQHSGEISLRASERNGNVVGWVAETKTVKYPSWELMKPLAEEAFKAFCKELDVKDVNAVEHWFNRKCLDDYDLIESLADTLDEYNEDEDFRIIFDKVKG